MKNLMSFLYILSVALFVSLLPNGTVIIVQESDDTSAAPAAVPSFVLLGHQ